MALGVAIIKLLLLRKKTEDPHLPSGPVLFLNQSPHNLLSSQSKVSMCFLPPSLLSGTDTHDNFSICQRLHCPCPPAPPQKAKFNQSWRQTASTGTKNHGIAPTGRACQQELMRRKALMEMCPKDTPTETPSKGVEESGKHDSEKPWHY